jgi:hypothetical protein
MQFFIYGKPLVVLVESNRGEKNTSHKLAGLNAMSSPLLACSIDFKSISLFWGLFSLPRVEEYRQKVTKIRNSGEPVLMPVRFFAAIAWQNSK